MLALPADLREEFKDPLGPVYDDVGALVPAIERARRRHGRDFSDGDSGSDSADSDPAADRDADHDADSDGEAPLIAVGDVVTYHLRRAGHVPDVAVVDGLTEREAVDEEIREELDAADARTVEVDNPPATLSRELLSALREAIDAPDPTTISVDGEEDLAALPAIVAAPDGASVVYGQPGEGMVHVAVAPQTRAEARTLFSRLDGDVDAALDLLD